jgi:hypothetical protein
MKMQIRRKETAPESLATTPRHCPDHGHRLVPIHRAQGGVRTVIGWTCTEPYCGHVEIDSRLIDPPRSVWTSDER